MTGLGVQNQRPSLKPHELNVRNVGKNTTHHHVNSVLLERGIKYQKYRRAQAKKKREKESSETSAFKQTKWHFQTQGKHKVYFSI